MNPGLFSSPAPALLLAYTSVVVLLMFPLLWVTLLAVALVMLGGMASLEAWERRGLSAHPPLDLKTQQS